MSAIFFQSGSYAEFWGTNVNFPTGAMDPVYPCKIVRVEFVFRRSEVVTDVFIGFEHCCYVVFSEQFTNAVRYHQSEERMNPEEWNI